MTSERSSFEPANLDEVQATDRLLSRLGERRPAPADLEDEVFGALFELVADVDAEAASDDEAMRRLVSALDGRPLYVLDGEDVAVAAAGTDLVLIDDPSWEADERPAQVIDLTAAAAAVSAAEEAAEGDAGREPVAEPVVPAEPVAPAAAVAIPAARREERWRRVARNAPLPVAAAIAVFALGAGITSALTGGHPVASISGAVGGAVSGDDETEPVSYTSLNDTLVQAQAAVNRREYAKARVLIEQARVQLGRVESPEAVARLKQTLAQVTLTLPQAERPTPAQVPPGSPAAVDPRPSISVAPSSPAQATPAPTESPVAEPTPTVPVPTTDPEPTPSASASVPQAEPSEAASTADPATP